MRLLRALARSWGLQVAYRDFGGLSRPAGEETLLGALAALGAPVQGLRDVPDALRLRRRQLWERVCEPVVVVWEGGPASLELRRAVPAPPVMEGRLELENGEAKPVVFAWDELPLLETATVEGVSYQRRRLTLPGELPSGYHTLRLDPDRSVLVIAAPRQVYRTREEERLWGVFLPLYALHSRRSLGTGDYSDLAELARWTAGLGGRMVGTLPLTPAFYDQPFAPSPYQPVSRLFWNELFLDLDRVEEVGDTPAARELLARFQAEGPGWRTAPAVDYRRVMAAKRAVLEMAARTCWADQGGRLAALRQWVAENPAAEDYARFRATVEKRGTAWLQWPKRLKNGDLREGDYDPQAAGYHLYVQWLAHGQLGKVAGDARARGQRLYLDLPLGVHPAGYDVWREQSLFVPGINTGAPPDAFFAAGQDWAFPPPHPEGIREQGYRYYIACLRHHLRAAGVLRLDHVMGLHRLFWVPQGLPASQGVYVHYRAPEFYAVLSLESRRFQAVIVGEDLGVVPAYVRRAMARHRLHRMYVLPFQTRESGAKTVLDPVPARCLALLNTHDMVPFAAFWQEEREKVPGLEHFLSAQGFLAGPTHEAGAVMAGCLAHLAASRAAMLQVNLEDLWLETLPQNVPGTTDEHPNWRRRARYALEEIRGLPGVLRVLEEVDRLRRTTGRRGRGEV